MLTLWEFEMEDIYEKKLKDNLPDGWTFGYIGNYWNDGRAFPDDRSWRIFTNAVTRTGCGTSVGSFESSRTPNPHQKLWEYYESGSAMALYERMIASGEWRKK